MKPDIVTVAKGISSAYLPMAATVVRNSVFKSFIGEASENRQVNEVNTYGGHPVAAAVARATSRSCSRRSWPSARPRTGPISSTASRP